MNIKNKILVVCHDAGGAEVISAYVKRYFKKYRFFCLLENPATKIFKRKKLNRFLISWKGKKDPARIFDKIKEIDLLLTGVSWTSTFERDFIREAKLRKIRTATYLDHWVNYRERFDYPRPRWQDNLSDEFWVGDEHAYRLAKKQFSNLPIRLVPNLYFKEIRRIYNQTRKCRPWIKRDSILFASEPLKWPAGEGGNKKAVNERQILEIFLKCLSGRFASSRVIIRLHPLERSEKYKNLIKKFKNQLTIVYSTPKEKRTFLDLARSSKVIGMKSMFLALACLCHKEVISFLPDENLHCPLPFASIKRVKKMEQLRKILV